MGVGGHCGILGTSLRAGVDGVGEDERGGHSLYSRFSISCLSLIITDPCYGCVHSQSAICHLPWAFIGNMTLARKSGHQQKMLQLQSNWFHSRQVLRCLRFHLRGSCWQERTLVLVGAVTARLVGGDAEQQQQSRHAKQRRRIWQQALMPKS